MQQIALFIFLLLNCPSFSLSASMNDAVWLLVDTEKLTLEVKKGNETLTVMKNISIGRRGAGFKQRIGDDITPIGSYKIGWINTKSGFYRFYGFTYPSVENAKQAWQFGLLSKKNYTRIMNAHKQHKTPPQNTPIGGRIGIHGLGAGNEYIHKMMNWTHGCIALTNQQINQLDPWIHIGMQVKVK